MGTLAAIFCCIALVCDVGIWYYVKGLNIYDDDDDDNNSNEYSEAEGKSSGRNQANSVEMKQNGHHK